MGCGREVQTPLGLETEDIVDEEGRLRQPWWPVLRRLRDAIEGVPSFGTTSRRVWGATCS